MNRPESVLLLLFLLLRRSELLHGLGAEILLLSEAVLVNLSAGLGHQHLGNGTMVAREDSPEDSEHALLPPSPSVCRLARAWGDILHQLSVHSGAGPESPQLFSAILVILRLTASAIACVGVGVGTTHTVLLQILHSFEARE